MSRRNILDALNDGPLRWCELRAKVEDRGDEITSLSQSTLYRLLAKKVVGRTKTAAGFVYHIADMQIAARTLSGYVPRSPAQMRTPQSGQRTVRPVFVGTIFHDVSIDHCARLANRYANDNNSCVVVVDPDRRCTLHQDGSAPTRKAWAEQFAHIVGTWTKLVDRSHTQRHQRVLDITEAIQHHIDIEAARTFAYGPTRGATAPISTGVPS